MYIQSYRNQKFSEYEHIFKLVNKLLENSRAPYEFVDGRGCVVGAVLGIRGLQGGLGAPLGLCVNVGSRGGWGN